MLARPDYTRKEIDDGRAMVEADLRAFRRLPKKARTKDFEALYFNRSVLLLDYMYVHRMSGIEGKDGNPLNEVRILCNSLLLNDGRLQIEKLPGWPESARTSLKLPPEKSVLGLKAGDEIRLTEDEFVRLSEAFFATLE